MQSFREMNEFLKLCLDIACVIDRDDSNFCLYIKELGFGRNAVSGILRSGVKSCINMQTSYYQKKDEAKWARNSEREARDFLRECFGDEEIDTINEEDKKRILELCHKIEKEWKEKEKEN